MTAPSRPAYLSWTVLSPVIALVVLGLVWGRTLPAVLLVLAAVVLALAVLSAVHHAEVVAHRVGLRPARPSVRLEAEGRVVHNYGHGGAGVTLSWGCAEEVRDLVASLVG